jgi:hypothetical protein
MDLVMVVSLGWSRVELPSVTFYTLLKWPRKLAPITKTRLDQAGLQFHTQGRQFAKKRAFEASVLAKIQKPYEEKRHD